MMSSYPSPLQAIVHTILTEQNAPSPAQILILGHASTMRASALAENLYPDVIVHQSTLHESDTFFQANAAQIDLVLFLNLPHPKEAANTENLVRNATDRSHNILLTLDTGSDTAPLDATDWVEIIRIFIEYGYGCDFRNDTLMAELPVLHLRRTTWTPAQIAAHLGMIAHHFWQQIVIAQRSAKQQDHLLASAVIDAQAIQNKNEQLARRVTILEEQAQLIGGDWERLRNTPGYAVMLTLQKARARITPPGSRRERSLEMLIGWAKITGADGLTGLFRHLRGEIRWRSQVWMSRFDSRKNYANRLVKIECQPQRPPLITHQASVDIVVCVHNALEDVQRCLASILYHTHEPYRIILVDDGSDPPTRDFLQEFVGQNSHAVLLRSEIASGYTKAANRGLCFSDADWIVLLNSDTLTTEQWLERMIACAESDERIGMVGPLSNTASWQSIPKVLHNNDWADNTLPGNMRIDDWARLIARHAGRIYPEMPFLNGFCLLVRRQLLNAIGYFDEKTFGAGYGEENDFALRARKAGWKLALADDAYVYHAQSRSYSHERRKQLSAQAHTALLTKHSAKVVEAGVAYCTNNWVLEGIRARASVLAERERLIQQGRRRYAGRRVLFLLPINHPGGGGNVVINESLAMRKMGVDVRLFNQPICRPGFERSYPNLAIPIHYGEPEDLPAYLAGFDAVVATWCGSVRWIAPALLDNPQLCSGYYVQDYEPLFFSPDDELYQVALDSYTLIPSMHLFTKTDWNRQKVLTNTGAHCTVIGPSIDIDNFRPLPTGEEISDVPLRVSAMVRPNTERRAPELTMRLLRRLSHHYADRVQITIFGVDPHEPGFVSLSKDFDWRLAGIVDSPRIGAIMAQTDVFVDFSKYQAMGLTAMEAMACGAAVIVPHRGGAESFARHQENALIVDTASEEACWEGLVQIVEQRDLRHRLRQNAIHSICNFPLERAALSILSTIFDSPGSAKTDQETYP